MNHPRLAIQTFATQIHLSNVLFLSFPKTPKKETWPSDADFAAPRQCGEMEKNMAVKCGCNVRLVVKDCDMEI
jgi:hypothetical protein